MFSGWNLIVSIVISFKSLIINSIITQKQKSSIELGLSKIENLIILKIIYQLPALLFSNQFGRTK